MNRCVHIQVCAREKLCWDRERLKKRGSWHAFKMGVFSPVANAWKDVLNKENSICGEEGKWNSESELNRQRQIWFYWLPEGNWVIQGIQSQQSSLWKSRMEFKENFKEVLSIVHTTAPLSIPAASSGYQNLCATTFLSGSVVVPLLLEGCLYPGFSASLELLEWSVLFIQAPGIGVLLRNEEGRRGRGGQEGI